MTADEKQRFDRCSALSREISACLDESVPDGMEMCDVLATLFGVGIVGARQRGVAFVAIQALWTEILLSQVQAEGLDVKVVVVPPGGTTPTGSDGSIN